MATEYEKYAFISKGSDHVGTLYGWENVEKEYPGRTSPANPCGVTSDID